MACLSDQLQSNHDAVMQRMGMPQYFVYTCDQHASQAVEKYYSRAINDLDRLFQDHAQTNAVMKYASHAGMGNPLTLCVRSSLGLTGPIA